MRRGVARGRIVPQSLSTDPRYGRLSLKAQVLYPLLWVNADDQGRVSGDPDEIKYAACPSIRQITVEDIPDLLEQMETQGMIKVYTTSKTIAVQMLDWWEEQRLQWAWPSRYPPPEGWQDRLRYKKSAKEVVTVNWGVSPENSPENSPELSAFISAVPLTTAEELAEEIRSLLMALPETVDRLVEHELIKDTLAKLGQRKGLVAKPEVTTEVGRVDLLWEERAGELVAGFEIDVYEPRKKSLTKLKALDCPYAFVILRSNPEPLRWEHDILLIGLAKERESIKEKEIEEEKEEEKGEGRGRGKSPELSGEPSPSLTAEISKILEELTRCFEVEWGRVPAHESHKVIRREPSARESTQLRDLAKNLSAVGGVPLDYIKQAFREAASHDKCHISYVRAVLLDWLGVPRGPP